MSWLPHVVTAQPATEPVSAAEAKAQAHIEADDTDFDTELNGYIAAARDHVEAYTGTKLVTQTVSLRCSSWCDLERLPVAPLQSVTSVTYLDSDGVEQTLAASVYESVLVGLVPQIRLKPNQSWPAIRAVSDAIRVVAVAGYGAASDVPKAVTQAMLLLIGDWFAAREDSIVGSIVNSMPNASAALLSNHRTFF